MRPARKVACRPSFFLSLLVFLFVLYFLVLFLFVLLLAAALLLVTLLVGLRQRFRVRLRRGISCRCGVRPDLCSLRGSHAGLGSRALFGSLRLSCSRLVRGLRRRPVFGLGGGFRGLGRCSTRSRLRAEAGCRSGLVLICWLAACAGSRIGSRTGGRTGVGALRLSCTGLISARLIG